MLRSVAQRALRRTLPLRAFSSQAEPTTEKLWIFGTRRAPRGALYNPTLQPSQRHTRPAPDTTLRDGEQSPGATLNIKEKVDIGNQLSRLGVDICEAGFPIASQGDFEAVREVAKTAGQVTEGRHGGVPMRIAGLSRANKKDIERCYDAVRHAQLNRIHTFLASSDIHLEHESRGKVRSWRCRGSPPVPTQVAPGGSGSLCTPGAEASPLGARPLPRCSSEPPPESLFL